MTSDQTAFVLSEPTDTTSRFGTMIVADSAMAAVVTRVENVATSNAIVMVTGESGVGKDLMAAHLHRSSTRGNGPFLSLDCEAGADSFPSAKTFGGGCFELADGGTLLLDEVGGMDLRMQAKLLGILQEKEAGYGFGGVPFDVRIVATTNKNLQREVRMGRFRADLYFRLNVVSIKIPPLRERPLDILALTRAFAQRFALANGRTAAAVSPEALALLRRHTWPGNVRELANVVQRAVLVEAGLFVTEGSIDIDPFDGMPDGSMAGIPSTALAAGSGVIVRTEGRTIDAVERDMILDTLCRCKANRSQAALILGISTRTLRNKLQGYERDGIRIPRPVVVAVA